MATNDPIALKQLDYSNPAHRDLSDVAVLALAQAGDPSAQWSLTWRVENDIRRTVGKFLSNLSLRGGPKREDFEAEARSAVAAVAPNWIPAKGKFSSYAFPIVFHACNEVMADQGGHVGVHKDLWKKGVELKKLRDEYEDAFGKAPLLHELAFFADLPEYECNKLLSVIRCPMPIPAEDGHSADANDSGTSEHSSNAKAAQVRTLSADGEVAADSDPLTLLEAEDQKEFIRWAVRQLDPEEQLVLASNFGLFEQPQRELGDIAKQMRTNKSRLYSMKLLAMKRLRGILAAKGITHS